MNSAPPSAQPSPRGRGQNRFAGKTAKVVGFSSPFHRSRAHDSPGNVVVEPGGIREAEAYLDRVNAALTGQPQKENE